jgi:hypothetical protein
MAEMKIPVDFERLQEFRLLLKELDGPPASAPAAPLAGMAAAHAVWMRLWVELSYEAQTTNVPGSLTAHGAELYAASLKDCLPASFPLLQTLQKVKVLRPIEGGWMCDRFASLNPHLAGNYKTKEKRGNEQSLLSRWKRDIDAVGYQQAVLIPSELFRRRDGTPIGASDCNRVRALINTLDRITRLTSARAASQFNEGLIADAADVIAEYSQERLVDFYKWLMEYRDHASVPRTTEQILAGFKGVVAMMGEE